MFKQIALTGLLALTLSACQTAPNTRLSGKPMPTVEQEAYTVSEQSVTLPNGQTIYGKLYRPNRLQGKQPIVIYSHGLSGNYENLEKFAKALAQKGLTGYAFDFRGGGDKSRSSGKTTEMTVLTEIDDLTNIVKAVQTWDFVDTQKIVLMGESQGGAVSALTASEMPDQIAGLITFYPAYAMVDDAKAKFPNPNEIPAVVRYFDQIDLGRQYIIDARNLNPYAKIGRYGKPMLLLHGDKDEIVNIKYSDQASKVYPKATYQVLKNAPHSFVNEPYFTQAFDLTENYLKQIGILE